MLPIHLMSLQLTKCSFLLITYKQKVLIFFVKAMDKMVNFAC